MKPIDFYSCRPLCNQNLDWNLYLQGLPITEHWSIVKNAGPDHANENLQRWLNIKNDKLVIICNNQSVSLLEYYTDKEKIISGQFNALYDIRKYGLIKTIHSLIILLGQLKKINKDDNIYFEKNKIFYKYQYQNPYNILINLLENRIYYFYYHYYANVPLNQCQNSYLILYLFFYNLLHQNLVKFISKMEIILCSRIKNLLSKQWKILLI